jgi:Immunity protein 35
MSAPAPLSPDECLARAARYVAEHAGPDYQVAPGSYQADDELFVFHFNTRRFLQTGDVMDCAVGQGPVIIDRLDGHIYAYGSATTEAEALADYRQLKLAWAAVAAEFPFFGFDTGRYSLIITKAYRKWPLLQALSGAGLQYVVPEAAAGIIWRGARAYEPERLEQRLRQQPTRFDDVGPRTVMHLYPLLKQPLMCRFELRPYVAPPHQKYVDRAGPADYEPRW